MPFLKDFIINNKTKIMTWNIVSGELDESHLNEYDKSLLKKRNEEISREYFLAVRKLLKIENPDININYDENGKPNSKIKLSTKVGRHMYDRPDLEKTNEERGKAGKDKLREEWRYEAGWGYSGMWFTSKYSY